MNFWHSLMSSWHDIDKLTRANSAAILRGEDVYNSLQLEVEQLKSRLAQTEAVNEKLMKWLSDLTDGHNKKVVSFNALLAHQQTLSEEVHNLYRLVMGADWQKSERDSAKRVH